MTLLQAIGLFAGCLSGSFIGVWLGRKLCDWQDKKKPTPTKAVANVYYAMNNEQAEKMRELMAELIREFWEKEQGQEK